ncbi:DUF6600 domain-containing protein [Spirosoma agri]|uniref:BcpO-related WXXGXW repeat protein n=1 Tax=Spirosoma agri TaxID=1987381 RepID=A0A6M0IKQ9_9BACT|nr:DUF6600 domain-containing protein [Spirosoma agri]NEU68422.1 hypothetical protein [Spirosoma agri]
MTVLKTIKLLGLITMLAFSPSFLPKAMAQPGVSVPVESFYDELAPYGQWTQYPSYGNVWIPDAGPDFQPYATGGHWVVTEYGNTWVSDYAWGWAPFHYGRWIYDPAYGGWLWIPDSDWGPAWVSWRTGGGYYGWAPLAPGMNVNININIPAPYWTFVPQIYITSPRLYSYCVPRPNVINIYQNTTIINNYYRTNNRAYAYGPPRGDIERVTRRSVPVYRIDNMDRPGRSVIGNGSVGFYRPNNARQDYGRNDRDRFDNGARPNYNNNGVPNRGSYNSNMPNRDYNGNNVPNRGSYNGNAGPNRDFNGNNAPGRDFDGNNTPGRDFNGNSRPNRDYNGNTSPDRRGSFSNPGMSPATPNPGTYPAPDRSSGTSRGTYQRAEPGNSGRQGGFEPQQQPNRSFERPGSQAQPGTQMAPAGREGGFQRAPENRGAQPQIQQRTQEPGQSGGRQGGFPGGGGRGPR